VQYADLPAAELDMMFPECEAVVVAKRARMATTNSRRPSPLSLTSHNILPALAVAICRRVASRPTAVSMAARSALAFLILIAAERRNAHMLDFDAAN
jgi:hypothetical protein